MIFARFANTGNAAAIQPILYNSTDSVSLGTLNVTTVNNGYVTDAAFVMAQAPTKVGACIFDFTAAAAQVTYTRSTFTTNWTGNWTFALRHGGITAPDTLEWEWAVYLVPGQ